MSSRVVWSLLCQRILAVMVAMGATACGGGDGIVTRPPPPVVPPVTIAMSPPSLTLTVGTSGFFAVAISGGSPTPTLQACSSVNAAIASVSVNGAGCQVTAIASGSTMITATATNGVQTSASVTVQGLPAALINLSVTPSIAALVVGQSVTLTASAATSPGATVSYVAVSSNPAVVIVSGSLATRTATAVAPGSATITVTATAAGPGLATTSRSVDVPITVAAAAVVTMTPSSLTLQPGATGLLAVTIVGGTPTPTLVACNSASASIATVSVSGASCRVTAVTAGNTTITATISNGQTVQAAVTVAAVGAAISGLTVLPSTPSVAVGQSVTLVPAVIRASPAVVVSYTYGSSAPAVATVSATGVVTGVAPGTAAVTITATGTGAGFTTVSLTTTVPVSVTTGNACDPTGLSLEVGVSRSIVTGSCAFFSSGGRVDNFRLLVPSARVVRLNITASFAFAGVLGRTVGALPFIWFTDGVSSASANFFMPAGGVDVGAISNSPQTGSYQFSATTQSEDVSACRTVTVLGSITTLQNLTAESCLTGGRTYDSFLVFAPGRSCTIAMRRVTGPSTIADPLVELWRNDGASLFLQNDDESPTSVNSLITLANCVDPTSAVVEVRARGFNGALGQYEFSVIFGPP